MAYSSPSPLSSSLSFPCHAFPFLFPQHSRAESLFRVKWLRYLGGFVWGGEGRLVLFFYFFCMMRWVVCRCTHEKNQEVKEEVWERRMQGHMRQIRQWILVDKVRARWDERCFDKRRIKGRWAPLLPRELWKVILSDFSLPVPNELSAAKPEPSTSSPNNLLIAAFFVASSPETASFQ